MGSFSHDYVYQFVTPLQPQASIPYELQLGHIHCRWFHGTLEQKGLSTDVCGCLWIWAMGHKNVNVWQELSSLFTNPESEAKEILPQLICGVNHPDCLSQAIKHPLNKSNTKAGFLGRDSRNIPGSGGCALISQWRAAKFETPNSTSPFFIFLTLRQTNSN